jgi:hypothetical protein
MPGRIVVHPGANSPSFDGKPKRLTGTCDRRKNCPMRANQQSEPTLKKGMEWMTQRLFPSLVAKFVADYVYCTFTGVIGLSAIGIIVSSFFDIFWIIPSFKLRLWVIPFSFFIIAGLFIIARYFIRRFPFISKQEQIILRAMTQDTYMEDKVLQHITGLHEVVLSYWLHELGRKSFVSFSVFGARLEQKGRKYILRKM